MERLTLYLRVGCGLCEQMLAELAPLRRVYPFELDEVDIDADPALRERYHTRVPVLAGPRGEICFYFLEREALDRYFAGG